MNSFKSDSQLVYFHKSMKIGDKLRTDAKGEQMKAKIPQCIDIRVLWPHGEY